MKSRFPVLSLLSAVALLSCSQSSNKPSSQEKAAVTKPAVHPEPGFRLLNQRSGFKTAFAKPNTDKVPPEKPPIELFDLVRYSAPLGTNAAYVTPVRVGEKRPAIVWIHGGFDFGIDSFAWEPGSPEDDQSASAFREAGLVLMLPSLRGTNDSPGENECFLGEVDDVIAAGRYLLSRPDVDPKRIYLGGHSTGGTMVLLAAASSDFFRGVFAFGATLSVLSYGDSSCVPESASEQEQLLRTPAFFFQDVTTPTVLIEGAMEGNGPYEIPSEFLGNAPISTVIVPGTTHFSVLRPGSQVVAEAILRDTREQPSFRITAEAIAKQMSGETDHAKGAGLAQ
ncbi:MAG: prolyl oligopeptidase family serine peptidase [Kofleriaceae bacterium]|nr:prolyl oligopeptidase family serine peptidase [Kofleriaceae bacterium]